MDIYPPYGPLAAERAQQLDELLRQFPACRAINPGRSVFDLPLELRGGKTTALRVTLTPHFPQERPGLSVLIPVAHPAVDPTGRVHTSLLANWVYGSSRLSSVVAEAVAALTDSPADSRQPGTAAAAAGPVGGTVPYPDGYPVPPGPLAAARTQMLGSPRPGSVTTSPSPTRQQQPPGPPLGPATSTTLPDFSRYTAAQLEELLQDASAFKELLKAAVRGTPMAATLEDIQTKNRQLAESNIAKQNTINEVRNQLAVVRSSEYTLIKSRFDDLYARQAKVLASMGGVVWRERLEEAVSAADSASAALTADFLNGDLTLDEFVRQHTEARTRHHALDLKRQAAEQLLAGDGRSGGALGAS